MTLEFNSFYAEFLSKLETLGFETRMVDKTMEFPAYHNQTRTEIIPVRMVVDPLTGKEILASVLFDNYVKTIFRLTFINPDRCTICDIINQ
jgi:hypothetical protein